MSVLRPPRRRDQHRPAVRRTKRTPEEVIGRALKAWSGRREQVFLATKVRGNDLSRAHIMAAVEQSLRHLQVEQVDLLQAHSWDAQHPIDETMRAFDDLVRQGK